MSLSGLKKIADECQSTQNLWTSLNTITARGQIPIRTTLTANSFLKFFESKTENVRASTASCLAPPLVDWAINSSLNIFAPTNVDEVTKLINSLPNKQCLLDPIPTWLLKKSACLLAPFLTSLFNKSFIEGYLPKYFKSSYITPVLKKPNLDCDDASSYRPISNLSVISKLLERLVLSRITSYLDSNNLSPPHQSAYRQYHSTETAVLKVFSDALVAADSGKITLLVLLDLSAAFDTVDHSILLQRLNSHFGFCGSALEWVDSYLNERKCQVRVGEDISGTLLLNCGVPQGSVLGPTLFTMYIAHLEKIISNHGLCAHFYADDTQIYGHCDPVKAIELSSVVSTCIDDVSLWMSSSRLQLNSSKSEVIWLSTSRMKRKFQAAPLRMGKDWISPSVSVRNLGAFFDSDMRMNTHVSRITQSCFSTLRQIKTVASSLPPWRLTCLLLHWCFQN